jgi:ADP-ribose pyrophosphatase
MIKINEIKKLTNERWINLFAAYYEHENGKTGKWEFASRNANPIPGVVTSNAVVVVAIHVETHKKKKTRKLVVNKEFRIPIGVYEYSSPAGLIDKDESPEEAATRELKEETGLTVTKVLLVSNPVLSSAGLTDEATTMVVVECEGKIDGSGRDATEDIETLLMSIEDINELRTSKNQISAKLWPFLIMFEGLGKVRWPKRKLKS